MKVRKANCLFLCLLGVLSHQLQVAVCSCPPLVVPLFGQLLSNGADVTQSQPAAYSVNATVEYRCAQGYGLVTGSSGTDQTPAVTTCMADGNWSLASVTCQLLPTDPARTVLVPVTSSESLNLLVPVREAMIIIGAVLGIMVVLLFVLVICCWCWALKMRAQLRGGGEAFESQQGAFIVSNPLMMIRDDEPSRDPLYLTPSEISEFDSHNTISKPQPKKK